MGKCFVDESLPKFIGTAPLSENDYIHCAINRSDLIINVGHDFV
jgi:acetolactate synthase-1/2/3 large subunit